MRRKLIGIPLAGLLLVGGATAVFAQSGAATALVDGAKGAGGLLAEVLSELVDDGTITQDQADAITDRLETRREEARAETEALREQLRTFLEDGTLSADELAQLPEDNPLRNLDEFLDDGQLTQDELQQLRGPWFGPGVGPGFGRGHHGGGFFFGPGPDRNGTDDDGDGATPDASASPEAQGSST
jgi:hypothetical protein